MSSTRPGTNQRQRGADAERPAPAKAASPPSKSSPLRRASAAVRPASSRRASTAAVTDAPPRPSRTHLDVVEPPLHFGHVGAHRQIQHALGTGDSAEALPPPG